MKSLALALALALLAPACRRHRRAPQLRDAREQFATACPDPRYVNAPAVPAPALGTGEVRAVSTVRLAGRRYVAWVTDEGAALWREGATASVRVTPPTPGVSVAVDATARRLVLAWPSPARAVLVAAVDPAGGARVFPPWASDVSDLALAAAPDGALVVWRDAAGLAVRPLGPEGEPLGAPVRLAPPPADAPAVARLGGRWAVVYRVADPARGIVRMRTIDRDGLPRGDAVDLVTTDPAVGPPAARGGGGRLAVTWSDARHGDRGLESAAFTADGRLLAEPQRLSSRYTAEARASLAWDGAAFGVTWWEPVGGGSPRSFFALLDRTGRRIGTAMRLLADDPAAALTAPALDWERPQYVLAVARGREVELRRTGPRGCDFPPVVAPR